jgi:hypothetical protein
MRKTDWRQKHSAKYQGRKVNNKYVVKVYIDTWVHDELLARARLNDASMSHQIAMDVEQANVEDRRRNVLNRKQSCDSHSDRTRRGY